MVVTKLLFINVSQWLLLFYLHSRQKMIPTYFRSWKMKMLALLRFLVSWRILSFHQHPPWKRVIFRFLSNFTQKWIVMTSTSKWFLTLTNSTVSFISWAISTRIGAILIHGGHQVAKKSTQTNLSPATIDSNSSSEEIFFSGFIPFSIILIVDSIWSGFAPAN